MLLKQLHPCLPFRKLGKRKKGRPVSRVLYLRKGLYHLSCPAIADAVEQPTPPGYRRHKAIGNKTGSLAEDDRDIFGFATHETYGRKCRHSAGALLPHLFTLIPTSRDGYFLLRCFRLSPDFPLGSMAPSVARTFLPDIIGAIERPADAKITKCLS